MSASDEFTLIRRCFAPLAEDPAARGLLDDAAVIGPCDHSLVVTTDAIVEGVHFLPDDPIDTVARKALRVNLSDLAAKASRPLAYLLTLFWPNSRPAEEIDAFAAGLAIDQAWFGMTLLGGDTVSTPGPLCVSITVLGRPLEGRAPDRRGGQAGDDLWISGPIGDGRLGLEAARGSLRASPEDLERLISRYRLPEPRLEVASIVGAHAQAAMDVSDGLLADTAKLAEASGLGAVIDRAAVPFSPAAQRALASGAFGDLDLLSGGDDYQVLCSAHPTSAPYLEATGFTRIGVLTARPGLLLREADGREHPAQSAGFIHRLGR